MNSPVAALILCFFPVTLAAQSVAAAPVASGYITSVDAGGGFSVEGWPVQLAPKAVFFVRDSSHSERSMPSFTPFVGEFVDVLGSARKGKSRNPILATKISQLLPASGDIHGTAIIDLVPPADSHSPDRILRADGRFLRIPPTTKVKFNDSLTPDTGFATNVWIDYHGVLQVDGTVVVDTASLRRNTVKNHEDKLDKKNEYDPAAVSPDAKQSVVSKAFLGLDVKRFPPHPDGDLQERMSRLGDSLVPAYQRSLAPEDPTRLNFRFQVVDVKELNEPMALPNGIVLVPFIGLDRLKSDSELAAPLAVAIAMALEKEQVRGRSARNTLTGARAIGYGAGAFIPGVGLAGDIAAGLTQKHLNELQIEQAGRVALCLMHDAGYDIRLAPIALWLSAPKKPKPIEEIKIPARAANLYKSLGTTWQPGSLASRN